MYSDEDIDSAIQAGILTEENAAAFKAHVERMRRADDVDEERFRLITGFNDVFVVIACILLLGAVTSIGNVAAHWLGSLLQAGVAWGLAEYFTRKRRMALPSIVLLLAFAGSVLATGIFLFPRTPLFTSVSCIAAAGAAWLHWLRFKVPITVAAGTAAVVGAAVAVLLSVVPEAKHWIKTITLAAGIIVFIIAMRWDVSDALRQTRRSDAAFWLHLLAAPLLVHPVFSSLGVFGGETTLWQAIAVIALYVAIALVSLSIDRRALMVSSLVYVLYTFTALFKQYGVVNLSFALTALAIGAALILLSVFWHPSRAAVLRLYPRAVRERLAPLR